MGNYDDYIKSINQMRETLETRNVFQQGLGLPPDINKNAEIGLDMVKTEMLLHIADDLKRIADSLEKLVSKEEKTNDTK